MSKETVRWIELVFGEGLSAEEASQKITAQLDEEATATEQPEGVEELAEAPVTEATEDDTADQEQESETEAPIDSGEE